ncbi:MAG: signal peptidase I [Candidatus Omnitrophota bacterium]|nr:signal peptidase I [Candidatus Omnitrophota bacterium]
MKTEKLVCIGNSMKPTLSPLDMLDVAPYNGKKIRPGDVIVFFSNDCEHKIAHRVVSVKQGKILTKGDNNNKVDTLSVSSEKIVGKVEYFERGKKRFRIYGGAIGRAYAFLFKTKQSSGRALSYLFGNAYIKLAKTGIALRLIPCREKIRTVVFKRPHGEDIQVFMGNLLIARRRPWQDKWYVRKPFRLFVEDYIK